MPPLASTDVSSECIDDGRFEVDLIVPVYKNRELTERCLQTLVASLAEISDRKPRMLIVNDSPDDQEVTRYLAGFAKARRDVVLLSNEANLGFVKSVNKALEMTKVSRRGAILVNSDTETFPGTLKELLSAAATDPQIGFACPRSNNAALSTFPSGPHSLSGCAVTPAEAHRHWKTLSHLLPRVTYAPTAVGFYLLIKPAVLLNFGPLNESFELGYEEENDLVLRANKVGYRAVLANHSFAYHAGSASFLLQNLDVEERKSQNLRKLVNIHPEFLPLVREYEASPEFRAERLIKNLLPTRGGRYDVLIDLNRMGPYTNGTSELALRLIDELLARHSDRFQLSVLCSLESFTFHKLDKRRGVKRVDHVSPDYAIALNPGQPFDMHQINVLEAAAPVVVYGMLDTIAQDCGHLRVGNDVGRYWRYVADHADGLFFISRFSRDTFVQRFPRNHGRHYTGLLPTRLSEYEDVHATGSLGQRHILVMGNHFAHKGSDQAGALISRKLGNASVVVLGSPMPPVGNRLQLQSGTLDDDRMAELFTNASVVVLPSYYEGFGFGLMHALALRKPVVARNIPATREILSSFRSYSGVILYEENSELPQRVIEAVQAGASRVDDAGTQTWGEWVDGLAELCVQLISAPDIYARCVERIHAGDALREHHQLGELLRARVAPTQHLPQISVQASEPAPSVASNSVAAQPWSDIGGVAQLLELPHDSFLQAAFWTVLDRPIDTEGLNHYSAMLQKGVSKEKVLRDIALSREAKARRPTLSGLDRFATKSPAARLRKLVARLQ